MKVKAGQFQLSSGSTSITAAVCEANAGDQIFPFIPSSLSLIGFPMRIQNAVSIQGKSINSHQRFNEKCLFNLALWCWFLEPFASGTRFKVCYEDRTDSSSVKANINKLSRASFSRISVPLILFGLPPAALPVSAEVHTISLR